MEGEAQTADAVIPEAETADAVNVPGGTQQARDEANGNTIKQAAQEAMRKHKLKVDGQEIEVDDNELKRGYAHQKAANERMQKGLAAQKQAEEFINMMRDPQLFYEAAQRLGHNPRDLAEKYLTAQLEDELADPRDLELRQTKAQLKQFQDWQAQQKQQEEQQKFDILKAQHAEDYTKQFIAALDGSGLPPSKLVVAEMARYVQEYAEIGKKITAAQAAQMVKEDVLERHRKLIEETDGEMLIKLRGEGVSNKIRKWDTSRIKTPEDNLRTPARTGNAPAPRQNKSSRMTESEWKRFNGR